MVKKLTGILMQAGPPQSTTQIRYLSGFTAPDAFLFLYTSQQQYLVVSSMEKGRAEKQAYANTEVFMPADLELSGREAFRLENWAYALLKKLDLRSIRVPADFPAGLYQKLVNAGISVQVATEEICPERKIKSRTEISYIRESQRAAVSGMEAAIDLIASSRIGPKQQLRWNNEPLTSEKVRQLVHKTLIEKNCVGLETIVAGGVQGSDPHDRGHGPLFAGQSIVIDIFPQSEKHGYWGDITRTVCRGPASEALRRLYSAVKAAQQAALRCVRPGVCSDEVHQAACTVFNQRGYQTKTINGQATGFIHGTGHGVGLEIHETPRVGRSGEILEAGHVITIEPGLYYPDLGGIRIEDTVVVTPKGWRYLAPCVKQFEI